MITILPGESACYRCLLPKLPPQNVIQGCKEAGVIGTTVGITGVLQANEIIIFILGEGSLLSRKFNLLGTLPEQHIHHRLSCKQMFPRKQSLKMMAPSYALYQQYF